jgi:flagellar basal-body rod modification protein FlgD
VLDPVIGTAGAAPSTPATTPDSALGQLGSDAFLQLLVAQLKYQNPLNPSDSSAMLEQTAMFTTVETLQSIAEMNQTLMGFQEVTMALGVVGKHVSALSLHGLQVEGVVESVRFTADGPFLSLDTGEEIPMVNLITVSPAGSGSASEPDVADIPVADPTPVGGEDESE